MGHVGKVFTNCIYTSVQVAYIKQSIFQLDAGKSTMGGNILYLTGMVDKRTLEKYEREAKEAGRESWYLSWALDTNMEERAKVTMSTNYVNDEQHIDILHNFRVKLSKLVELTSKLINVVILFWMPLVTRILFLV